MGPCVQVEGRTQGRQRREAALLSTRSGQSATSVHFAGCCKCHDPVIGTPAEPCVAFELLKTLASHVTERQAKINADVVGFSLTSQVPCMSVTDIWYGLRTGRWVRLGRLPPCGSMVHVPRVRRRSVRVPGQGKPSDAPGVRNVRDTRYLPCTRL
jgi:hypothetical protein